MVAVVDATGNGGRSGVAAALGGAAAGAEGSYYHQDKHCNQEACREGDADPSADKGEGNILGGDGIVDAVRSAAALSHA